MNAPLTSEQNSAALTARLALRVRKARKAKGLPRRVLSELSGVSPRYLAQLEAGEGNISVLLLERIAAALDLRIEALLVDDAPPDRDATQIAVLFRQAPPDVQSRVRALLSTQNAGMMRAGRVCLLGLRGAGKSTLGKMAGEALGIPFVELNRDIEQEMGMPLTEIMALYGTEGYRRLEADALERISMRHDRMILAVAGGIVAEPPTYARLLERFHSVWIKTTPAEHIQRVRAQGDLRPMQGNPAAMGQLKALLEERTPLYARAEAQVDTAGRMPRASLNELLAVISSRGFLGRTAE